MAQPDRQSAADPHAATEREVERIVAAGPAGTFAVAGVATAIVVVTVLLFYIFVYVPRGVVQ
ncbi:hypothetical protein KOL96_06860 (plasmid) [Ralstonia wenshanensis]|uniref:hypothetical protein n=1 Tax=Ralstonia wenshanensis TaxID=2842456 RepID=UPI001E515E2A|nr:hypothetical protein [Ralstonia wenshanensis]UGS88488.1 hypothetical protein KOL96_06860 [Ralstonia wenshanensis]